MPVFSIEPPIPEMMERIRALQISVRPRSWKLESPDDFRALMQNRATIERIRDEMIEASLAQGERRRRMVEQLELYERPAARTLRSRWTG
jgi:hypothetical protein